MKRRRFLSLAGLSIGLLFPSSVVQASGPVLKGESGLFLPEITDPATGLTVHNTIYLTFDDGYVGLAEKVAALNALEVRGTFFLTGEAIYADPGSVQWLVDSGHVLANHTYTHPSLTNLSAERIAWEVQACDQAALDVAGVRPQPYVRPPYGEVSPWVRSVLADLGYETVLWNWDTLDWAGKPAWYIEQNIGPGIVLMHTHGVNTVQALSNVVSALAERGYLFAVF